MGLFLVASGCLTPKRAARKLAFLQSRFPELFQSDTAWLERIERDTIVWVYKEVQVDTFLVRPASANDTIDVGNDTVQTRVIVRRDTVVRYRITTRVRPDTVTITLLDTLTEKVIERQVTTRIERIIPKWIWIMLTALALIALLGWLRRR